MAGTAGAAYTVSGVLGVLTATLAPNNAAVEWVWVLSLASLAAGGLMIFWGARLPAGGFYGLTLTTVALIGLQVWLQRGHPEATAAALLLLLLTMFAAAFFEGLAAQVVVGSIVALVIVAGTVWRCLPTPTVVVLAGLCVVVAVVTAWLVGAAAGADRDALTGLPNERGLMRELAGRLASLEPQGQPMTLTLLEFDRLANTREGDRGRIERILRDLVEGWIERAPSGAFLARHNPDGVAVVLPAPLAEMTTMLDRWRIAAATKGCSFSAGVSTAQPDDAPALLFSRVNAALYEAQRAGGNRTFHSRDSSAEGWTEMAAALATGQFNLVYQPIVNAVTGHVTGAEALLRWTHPERGPISPVEFIPLAERSGFIIELDRWVLETACREAASWPRTVPSKITANVSGRELQRPGYERQVTDILESTGLPADRLVLEITETTFEADSLQALDTLRRLRQRGIRVAIDDFGTGYSSLSRLQHLPADFLKIDRSFVASLGPDTADAPVVAAITALAYAVGLRTVAEGVEEPHQAALLVDAGCDEFQGWLHGRPGPPEIIRDSLAALASSGVVHQHDATQVPSGSSPATR